MCESFFQLWCYAQIIKLLRLIFAILQILDEKIVNILTHENIRYQPKFTNFQPGKTMYIYHIRSTILNMLGEQEGFVLTEQPTGCFASR